MKKLMAVCALVLGFASVSQAGVLIEPYLGYEMGKTKDFSEGKYDGTQMGLRLAYKTPVMLWLGVDGTFGVSGKVKPDVGTEEDATRTTMYGVVGIDLPILLRGWVGYSFSDEVKVDSGKFKGSGYKVGLGFTGLPFVSLNFEYINEKFNDFEGISLPQDLKNDSYVLSVSLPLSF